MTRIMLIALTAALLAACGPDPEAVAERARAAEAEQAKDKQTSEPVRQAPQRTASRDEAPSRELRSATPREVEQPLITTWSEAEVAEATRNAVEIAELKGLNTNKNQNSEGN